MSQQADDLVDAADISSKAATEAFNTRHSLGVRPNDPSDALVWDRTNQQLKGRSEDLFNSALALRALAVTAALDPNWPALNGLDTLSDSIQTKITAIQDLSGKLSKFAEIIDFGVSIVAFLKSPSLKAMKAVATAYRRI